MPDVFRNLCIHFHQDVGFMYSSPDEPLERFLAQASEADKITLRNYLSELLQKNLSEEELQDLLIAGGA